jgi:hypothetical protein
MIPPVEERPWTMKSNASALVGGGVPATEDRGNFTVTRTPKVAEVSS